MISKKKAVQQNYNTIWRFLRH